MYALGQDHEAEVDAKIAAIKNIAEFRDQLFDDNVWVVVKVIGGTLIGLYFVYRFLLK